MIETKTVLLQGFFTESRRVQCDFIRVVYQDGVEIARADKPHTVLFDPDAGYDTILAAVNADITTRDGMKWPPIEPTEWQRAMLHCAAEHTSEVRDAFIAFKNSQITAGVNQE